jgi:hypothetical protein
MFYYFPENNTGLVIVNLIIENLETSVVFGWSGGPYFLADVLYLSEGYWIYSYEPCTLNVIV